MEGWEVKEGRSGLLANEDSGGGCADGEDRGLGCGCKSARM